MIKTPITKRFAEAKRAVDFKWKIYPASDDKFYCELELFYNGYLDEKNRYLDKKWQSERFKTIKDRVDRKRQEFYLKSIF